MLNQNKVWDQLRPVDSYADAILIDQLTQTSAYQLTAVSLSDNHGSYN